MLKPEVKAKWVAALRSGDYSQTVGKLRGDNVFCCLGVLREIDENIELENMCYYYALNGSTNALPFNVQSRLQMLNDKEHKTFLQIADHIEMSNDI